MTQRHARKVSISGVSLIEIMIAVSVVALSLGGLFATFSASASLAASQRQTAAATAVIMGRFEQIRAGNWTQITSPEGIEASILNSALPGSQALHQLEEVITISEYPPATPPADPIRVRRTSAGAVQIESRPSMSLLGRTVVRVDVRASWKGTGGRTRVRESSSVVALGGIGK